MTQNNSRKTNMILHQIEEEDGAYISISAENSPEYYMPANLYQRLIQCGILKRSIAFQEDPMYNRIILDEKNKMKIKTGEMFVRYVLAIKEVVNQRGLSLELDKYAIQSFLNGYLEDYSQKATNMNWILIDNTILRNRVRLEANTHAHLMKGNYQCINLVFEEFDKYILKLSNDPNILDLGGYRKQLKEEDTQQVQTARRKLGHLLKKTSPDASPFKPGPLARGNQGQRRAPNVNTNENVINHDTQP